MKPHLLHRFTAALALTAAAHAGDSYAVKAGTVMTMGGDPIENGVIVMQDGRIAEVGSHEQLMGSESLYRRLYELQFTSS